MEFGFGVNKSKPMLARGFKPKNLPPRDIVDFAALDKLPIQGSIFDPKNRHLF